MKPVLVDYHCLATCLLEVNVTLFAASADAAEITLKKSASCRPDFSTIFKKIP
ncbi:hypothetical protein BN1184_BE_00360 [Pantoea ananatis]|nr:hypothetical protein BN1184_BE_00360 [Pantoea ananatis]